MLQMMARLDEEICGGNDKAPNYGHAQICIGKEPILIVLEQCQYN
jgi:hypothetical protein